MSYILDALKKSEQERQRANGPTLATVHRPPARRSGQRNALAGAVLGGAAVLAVAVYFAPQIQQFWQQESAEPVPTSLPQAAAPAEAIPPVAAPAATETASAPTPATQEANDFAAMAPTPEPVAQPATVNAEPVAAEQQPLQELWQLPEDVRASIPPMTFSFHVYSDNPERRTIIINGKRLREGDMVEGDMQLGEITSDGVILRKAGHRFYLKVVENW